MEKKHVVIGVSGGIAAYKACDLVSKLSKKDYGKTLSNLQNLNIGSSLSKVINYANQFWCDDHKGFFTKYFSWLGF